MSFERLFKAANKAAKYDKTTDCAAYWAALRAVHRMRINIPGVSREALAGAIAEELPGDFCIPPAMMDRLCEAVPELDRRETRRRKMMARLLGEDF